MSLEAEFSPKRYNNRNISHLLRAKGDSKLRLNMWLVGQYRITLDDRLIDLGYNKVRALLAYLALESDRAHGRDELAGLLWPGSPEEAARKSLRQALTTLRTAICDEDAQPPYLLVTRETIQFNSSSDFYSDAFEFGALMAQSARHLHKSLDSCPACIERLAQAAALYKGDLLKNLSIAGCLPFEEWLLLGRERLRLQMIDGLGLLVAGCERRLEDERAIQFSRQRLVLDPWNEDAYRSLMRVLARRGQRTAALVEFERCKRVLAEELGIEPSAETAALSEQIRRQTGSQQQNAQPAEGPAAPRLPLPLTALIGREKESAALLALLRRDDVRLVTLMGPPGIGKSRLAVHAANALGSDFEGNVFFISLASVSNPILVTQKIAQALGMCEGGCSSPVDLLVPALKDRKALLVLDTFEQVLDAAPALLELLRACPQLKILVTASAPLHLSGERRFLLHPLALPNPADMLDAGLLAASPAVRLFVERAQAVMPEFMLNSKNAQAIAAICARLDGLPLAIELAAASVRLMPPQKLLERLSGASGSALQLLKQPARDGSAHHQTLRQAFQWSYDLLDSGARMLFARLGVFVGSWTLEAADAVCNVGDIQLGGMDGMAVLLDNCLLQQKGEGPDGEYRFTMLGTLREFALDNLAASGELDTLRQRHADYFLTFAKLAEPELTGLDQLGWLDWVEQDLDNLRAALDWTLAASPGEALQLAAAMFPFWHMRAYLVEGLSYLEQALARNPGPTPLRGWALAAAGLMAQLMADFERAETLIDESIRLCRQLDDRRGLAFALNNLAIVVMSLGDNSQALQLAEESLKLCHEPDFPLGVARAQMIIGQIALNEDRLETAWQSLETSLAFWRKKGDMKNAILCQIDLGRVKMAMGDYPQALVLFEESFKLSRKLKDHHWEMAALWNSAEIHLLQGNYEDGAPLLTTCLEQARRLGDRYFEAISISRLGLAALGRGDYDQGIRLLNASLDLGRQIGSKWVAADALAYLGYAALLSGELQAAEERLKESLDLFYQQGERSALVLDLEWLSLVYLGQDDPDKATRLLGAASAWRSSNREPLPPVYRAGLEQALAQLQSQPDDAVWRQGLTLTLEQAVAYVRKGRQ